MIIFLRGLPGCGKTTIADNLVEKLKWEVLHVDDIKGELMKQKPQASFVEEIVPASYKLALERLQSYQTKNVIVEEMFRNKDFVQQVLDFCHNNNIKYQWFKIWRDKKLINQVNDERKRKVKNTPKVIEMMEQQINNIKIAGEVEVENKDIAESIDLIVGLVSVYPLEN